METTELIDWFNKGTRDDDKPLQNTTVQAEVQIIEWDRCKNVCLSFKIHYQSKLMKCDQASDGKQMKITTATV